MKTTTALRLFVLVLCSSAGLGQTLLRIEFKPVFSTYNTTVPPVGPSYQGIQYKAYIYNSTCLVPK